MHFSFISALSFGLFTTRQGFQHTFVLVAPLDIINLLFSVMGFTCRCPDAAGYSLASPTLACCSQQWDGGATYHSDTLTVRRLLTPNSVVTDTVTMDSALMCLMLHNLWVVALVSRVKEAMVCRGSVNSCMETGHQTVILNFVKHLLSKLTKSKPYHLCKVRISGYPETVR